MNICLFTIIIELKVKLRKLPQKLKIINVLQLLLFLIYFITFIIQYFVGFDCVHLGPIIEQNKLGLEVVIYKTNDL